MKRTVIDLIDLIGTILMTAYVGGVSFFGAYVVLGNDIETFSLHKTNGNVWVLALLFFVVFNHLGRLEDAIKKSK